MKEWIVGGDIFHYLALLIFIGVLVCMPFVQFARRFGHFFFVIIFFLFVVGLLEVGYANLFIYHFGEIARMDDQTYFRFAFGGFALIIGFIIDFIIIVIIGANEESQTDNRREGFLDKMDRIHEEDAKREHMVTSDSSAHRWEISRKRGK